MGREVDERLLQLKRRIEKEIDRGPLPEKEYGDTTAIGGWAKIGLALEALFAALFRELARQSKLPEAEALRDHGVLRKPTIGQWCEALIEIRPIAAKVAPLDPVAKSLLDDLGKDKMSVLYALTDIRNRLQHQGTQPRPLRPSPREAMEALKRASVLLARIA